MRLTNKDIAYRTSGANVIEIPDIVEGHKYSGQAIIKLGHVEDIEEKHNILSLDVLDNRLTALEIVANKSVDVGFLQCCSDVDTYNNYIIEHAWTMNTKKLTQEEYELLKDEVMK